MASKIEWTEETWNPVVGCSIVSPGCTNCYAMKMAGRLEAMGVAHYQGLTQPSKAGAVWTGAVATAPHHVMTAPMRWRKPRTIFVNSMSDLFHPSIPFSIVDQVLAIAALTPRHTYQILTKRPERMAEYFASRTAAEHLTALAHAHARGTMPLSWHAIEAHLLPDTTPEHRALYHAEPPVWPLPNVWLGASVEDQGRADERRQPMADIAAAGWTTFVSYEPALGMVDWTGWEFLKWLIAGGESGPGARTPLGDWFRVARDWCAQHGIAFFFKQWGAWSPTGESAVKQVGDCGFGPWVALTRRRKLFVGGGGLVGDHCPIYANLGKAASGRLLDGGEHNAMPEVSRG
jgi:protein gp37